MRAYVPSYEMKAPRDLGDALKMLASDPGWRPFAGGTDLMVVYEAGKLPPGKFLSLWSLDELRGIRVSAEAVEIGALTTYTQIQREEVLCKEFPLLTKAASETGAIAIQNRGTLGGNIVNASPAADSPPALAVYEAELELVSARGSRRVPYVDFHTGYKATLLKPGELLRSIRLERKTGGLTQYYRKVGTRKAQAISKVCFAGVGKLGPQGVAELRIALGSVAPTVLRARKTEAFLRGKKLTHTMITQAREEILREIAPIDDIRSNREFRSRVCANLLEEFLAQLLIARLRI